MSVPTASIDFQNGPLGQTELWALAPGRDPADGTPSMLTIPGEGTSSVVSMDSGAPAGLWARATITLNGNAAGWTFGFVQFLVQEVLRGDFEGGSATLTSSYVPAADQRRVRIDVARGSTAERPWYHHGALQAITAGSTSSLTVNFDDRPADALPLRRVHPRTRLDLFLRHARFTCEFHTVLAARDPSQRWHVLRAFAWGVDWDLSLTRSGDTWQISPTRILGKRVDRPAHDLPASASEIAAAFAAGFAGPAANMPQVPRSRSAPADNFQPA
jgi:hypothetical protein